ncbi:MAG: iron chelate uptake ABC transporter family permease subunit [Eisenbergiella porci]|nr:MULTISPECIES: iron chelate uptake ABC transporter family permease subunit [Eisenbergiella]MDY2654711.1 iron chelate uptake ABC transporter family permease subunit [Eisenbergiella porci]MDY5527384.1 iron chelate uptake ABC transporter family permease subunit [Eisenbergiella porci]
MPSWIFLLTFSAALVKRNECERTKKDDLVSACGRCCGLSGRSSFRALWKHGDHFGQVVNAVIRPDAADQQHIVVRELRIPRTLGCILAGAAFSAAGSLMQGVTRNPLADSGLLASMREPLLRWRSALLFYPDLVLQEWLSFPFWARRFPCWLSTS